MCLFDMLSYRRGSIVWVILGIHVHVVNCNRVIPNYHWSLLPRPGGVARYCFHPVSVYVCVCMSVCVCPANILVFYLSAIRRDIDLKFIQDIHRVVLNSPKQIDLHRSKSRSQGRYIAF